MNKQNKNKTNDSPKILPTENDANTDKKPIWLICILIGVIIICILLGLHQCGTGSGNHNDPSDTSKPGTSVDGGPSSDVPGLDDGQGDYIPPDRPVAGGVAIPGWAKMTIPPNQTENIVVDFYNPEANEGKYYLTFELRIPANNEQGYEVLYKSGLILPGKHIQNITLNRGLAPGTYNAILHVQPYRMSDKSTTNNADIKLELVVK